MKSNGSSFFWPSFADLMTSLFFIMLVLYVLTVLMLKKKENELIEKNKELEHKLAVYDLVEKNLKPLKNDTSFFRYDDKYKRFTLAFDLKFIMGKSKLNPDEIENFDITIANIDKVGAKLLQIIDTLNKNKLKDVSYLLIISGYASKGGSEFENYVLSYKRALSLRERWFSNGIDFENKEYHGLVDLQISGSGLGGVGRFENTEYDKSQEEKNQRFIIQIVPKIADTN